MAALPDPRPAARRAVGRRAPRVLAGPAPLPGPLDDRDRRSGSRRTASSTSRCAARTGCGSTRTRSSPSSGGTLMTDRVRYAIPYGPLGALAHVAFVRRDLRRIFDYRRDAVAALLGDGAATLSRPCRPSPDRSAGRSPPCWPPPWPPRAARPANPPAPPTSRTRAPGHTRRGCDARTSRWACRPTCIADRYEGRTVLRATNNLKSRGEGPVMLRGTRTGKRDDARPPAHLPRRRLTPGRTHRRDALASSTSRVRARTGSGPTPRASSCGRSTRRATASGSCGPGRRSSTACAT